MHSWSRAILAASVYLTMSSFALADVGPAEQFIGEYRDVSTRQSKQRIGEAIERATSPMGVFVRGVARKRLAKANPTYATFSITRSGDVLTTHFAGRSYAAALEGRPRRNVAQDGCPIDVSYSVRGNTLHARYRGADGEKLVKFTAVAGKPAAGVHVTVTSERLPRPVAYKLAYLRLP